MALKKIPHILSESATLLITDKSMPTTNNGPNWMTAVKNYIKKEKLPPLKKTMCNAKDLLGNTCTLV